MISDMRREARRVRESTARLVDEAEALEVRNQTVEQCAQQNIDWLRRVREALGVRASLSDVDEMCRRIEELRAASRPPSPSPAEVAALRRVADAARAIYHALHHDYPPPNMNAARALDEADANLRAALDSLSP